MLLNHVLSVTSRYIVRVRVVRIVRQETNGSHVQEQERLERQRTCSLPCASLDMRSAKVRNY